MYNLYIKCVDSTLVFFNLWVISRPNLPFFLCTYVVSSGDATIWNKVEVQRFLLPYRVHHHQCLNRKIHLIRSQLTQKLNSNIYVRGVNLPHLNDQHVLSEVVPFFEDYPNRCSRGGGRHGRELQPQRLLLRGHHLAFVQLDNRHTKRTVFFLCEWSFTS